LNKAMASASSQPSNPNLHQLRQVFEQGIGFWTRHTMHCKTGQSAGRIQSSFPAIALPVRIMRRVESPSPVVRDSDREMITIRVRLKKVVTMY
jgi:hypothetical protein